MVYTKKSIRKKTSPFKVPIQLNLSPTGMCASSHSFYLALGQGLSAFTKTKAQIKLYRAPSVNTQLRSFDSIAKCHPQPNTHCKSPNKGQACKLFMTTCIIYSIRFRSVKLILKQPLETKWKNKTRQSFNLE